MSKYHRLVTYILVAALSMILGNVINEFPPPLIALFMILLIGASVIFTSDGKEW